MNLILGAIVLLVTIILIIIGEIYNKKETDDESSIFSAESVIVWDEQDNKNDD